MNQEEIKSLNKLAQNEKFSGIIKKLTIGTELLENEKTYKYLPKSNFKENNTTIRA